MTSRELTTAKRLEFVERDLRDHAKSLSAHTDAVKTLEVRVEAIEKARAMRALEEVRREEREEARYVALGVRIDGLTSAVGDVKAGVATIKGTGVKIAWIVISLVLGAASTWILKGGFFTP